MLLFSFQARVSRTYINFLMTASNGFEDYFFRVIG